MLVAGGAALWGWTWSEERLLQDAVRTGAKPTLTYEEATSRAGTWRPATRSAWVWLPQELLLALSPAIEWCAAAGLRSPLRR